LKEAEGRDQCPRCGGLLKEEKRWNWEIFLNLEQNLVKTQGRILLIVMARKTNSNGLLWHWLESIDRINC